MNNSRTKKIKLKIKSNMKNAFRLTGLLLIIFLTVITGISNLVNAQEQKPGQNDPLFTKSVGIWEGKLVVESTELPLIFKIKLNEQKKFVVTLDSPLQNAFDIPLGDLSNETGQLKINAPSINGYYLGKFVDPSTLDGTWTQNGATFPLKLLKKEEAK